jgi:hypothetical protein
MHLIDIKHFSNFMGFKKNLKVHYLEEYIFADVDKR